MSQRQRQAEILQLIEIEGYLTIDSLVEHFQVTPQTIRRDLAAMNQERLLERDHGGAKSLSSVTNTQYQMRKTLHEKEKEDIAHTLVKLIPNGASLFINIGTTTEAIARALMNHERLRVVTNNIHVASIMSSRKDFRVMIAPGEVRSSDGGIVGDATRDYIESFRMDFAIIGISGIHTDGSLLDFDDREVSVAKSIIKNSAEVILAADSSKFNRNAMVQLGNISQADHLVTNQKPSPAICSVLKKNKVVLHLTG
ncbi:MAG: DeoR/GlpR family transcriptional regulator [SAR86 cluster bacterium]|uniref:DeoR/GlpR family transcriptional regulator n=1 Tax=SAR86 cluster bacterium TaxID=2030880 RepID=A0A2A4MSG1_9GAMM|nr:MAG: DeoR/GlpR family transcriptional regulator [SAR86 cluster bacterium]